MNPNDQIRAVAELAGWIPWREEEYPHRNGFSFGDEFGDKCLECDLPDYLNSRDAIVPAIEKMDCHKRNDFIAILWEICGNEKSINFWTEYNMRGIYSMLVATPAQLCEALLRATGKWKE